MPGNLNMENIIIHSKTRDMLPFISSTILHVRYSEHANSKSVQKFPHLTIVMAYTYAGLVNLRNLAIYDIDIVT